MKSESTYESPRITQLGKIEHLTLHSDKKAGHTDGLTFLGHHLTNHS